MTEVTDDFVRSMLSKSRPYTVVILRKGPSYGASGSDKIVWEHVRRNFSLRADGKLDVVLPVTDGEDDVRGIGVFSTDQDETRSIMDADPGVQAGVFRYDVHLARSFPGDALSG
jgi:hypothetical protein